MGAGGQTVRDKGGRGSRSGAVCEMSPLSHSGNQWRAYNSWNNSSSVISFFAPTYPSIFHSIKVLRLDTPGLPNPVDILPHLHQLETLTATHFSFPIYHDEVNMPFNLFTHSVNSASELSRFSA